MHRGPITEEQRARMPQLYKKGQTGNPRGASSLTMLRTHENARKAVALREKMLDTLASRIATIEVMTAREFGDDPQLCEETTSRRIMALLTPDVNRLITDSENRGLGAPRQSIDVDAVLTDVDRRRPEDFSDEELAAILAAPIDVTPISRDEMEVISGRVLAPTSLPLGPGE